MLKFYYNALHFLSLKISNTWSKILKELDNAIEELEIYSTISYNQLNSNADINLPNAWYITPYGDLYNVGGNSGHKENSLIYPYQKITDAIFSYEDLNKKQQLLNDRKRIIDSGYINRFEFQHYLNYANDFISIYPLNGYENDRAYNRKIVQTVLGVVSAQAGLFSFFEELQKKTKEPIEEIIKIEVMTNNTLSDILVRCAGFHKIESVREKTITTSSTNLYEDLYEYLKRGWDICFIPPIIINQEKKQVSELDMFSPIVEKYIEEKTTQHEKIKQLRSGYGRVY